MEFELIEHLRTSVADDSRVKLGIGDDCAVLPLDDEHDQLITADLLVDGVHFVSAEHSLAQIARKSLAVSVSDIAAMAGQPVAAFVSVALPRSWAASQARELFEQFAIFAQEFEIIIAGGDTTTTPGPLAINVTLTGTVAKDGAILRSGARIGDIICVSGLLGGSIHGKQFSFTPRVKEAQYLRQHTDVSAMIDISDGLISDLRHVLAASGVGAVITAERVPLGLPPFLCKDGKTALEHALTDGEDFELLWTMPESDVETIRGLRESPDCPVEVGPIGRIVAESGVVILDEHGAPVACNTQGYVHDFN